MVDSIKNLLIPEVWDPYFLELTTEKTDLIESGIVVRDSNMDRLAMGGGNTIDLPFFDDLTGDDAIIHPGDDLTPTNISAKQDMCRLHIRGDARRLHDLEGSLTGTDPLAMVAARIHNYWMRKEQKVLLATLKGVFADNAANDSNDLIFTAAAEALADVKPWNDANPTVMNPVALLDAQQLLGDASDRFVAIVMHSKCLNDLKKQELIDTERPSDRSKEINYYGGIRVIKDDSCPTRDGTTDGTVYRSYLFAEGAIARGEGRVDVPSEFQREGLASETYFITRRSFILHPRGIKWTNSSIAKSAPTNAECEMAVNWDRVYQKKNIRTVMLETN
jgi:hypothetical protein